MVSWCFELRQPQRVTSRLKQRGKKKRGKKITQNERQRKRRQRKDLRIILRKGSEKKSMINKSNSEKQTQQQ